MFSYQGSKRKELNYIRDYEPENFEIVVDVFGGGGNVFLDYVKRYPTKKVIYNDFDKCLTDIFYTVAIGNGKYLQDEVNAHISLEKHRDRVYKIKAGEDEKTPLNFLSLSQTGFRGIWNNATPRNDNVAYIKLCNYEELVNDPDVILNMDYKELMNKYKSCKEAFLYLDPPYAKTDLKTYKKGGDKEFLPFILKFMKDPETKCKVMLHVLHDDFVKDEKPAIVYVVDYNLKPGQGPAFYKPKKSHCIIINYPTDNKDG